MSKQDTRGLWRWNRCALDWERDIKKGQWKYASFSRSKNLKNIKTEDLRNEDRYKWVEQKSIAYIYLWLLLSTEYTSSQPQHLCSSPRLHKSVATRDAIMPSQQTRKRNEYYQYSPQSLSSYAIYHCICQLIFLIATPPNQKLSRHPHLIDNLKPT